MPLLPEDVPALGPQPLPTPAKQKSGTVDRTGTDPLLESRLRGPGWGCGMGQRRGGLAPWRLTRPPPAGLGDRQDGAYPTGWFITESIQSLKSATRAKKSGPLPQGPRDQEATPCARPLQTRGVPPSPCRAAGESGHPRPSPPTLLPPRTTAHATHKSCPRPWPLARAVQLPARFSLNFAGLTPTCNSGLTCPQELPAARGWACPVHALVLTPDFPTHKVWEPLAPNGQTLPCPVPCHVSSPQPRAWHLSLLFPPPGAHPSSRPARTWQMPPRRVRTSVHTLLGRHWSDGVTVTFTTLGTWERRPL